MATVNSRVQFNITARNQTAGPFAATRRGLDNLSGAARNLKFALGAAIGGNVIASAVRGLININRNVEPVTTAFNQMHRAFQAFAFAVGNAGLNAALISFSQTIGAMVGRTDSLSNAIGVVLGGAVKGVEILFVTLGRAVGFVSDNFQFFQQILTGLVIQQVAIRVVAAARSFVAFAATIRAAGLAMAFFHSIQRVSLTGFLAIAAGAAYATGNLDKLTGAIKFLVDKAKEMVPGLQRFAVEGLANMGLDVSSLTVDLDALKGSLSSLPPVIDNTGAKARRFIFGTSKVLKTDLVDAAEQVKDVFSGMGDQVADSLLGLARRTTTVTEAVRNMANDILSQLTRIALNRIFQQLFTLGVGSFFGGTVAPGVGAGGMGFSHFGGPRASGGPIRKGMFYTVGENGPETLVAGGDGHIVPSRGGGGGTQVNVYNNSGAPVQTRKRQQGGMQITDIIIGEVKKAMGDGRFDGIMGQKFGMRPQLTSR